MKYVSYNKLYQRGKAVGGKFKVITGKSRNDVIIKTNKYNSGWNKMKSSKKQGYVAKMVEVKKTGVKKRTSSPFGINMKYPRF